MGKAPLSLLVFCLVFINSLCHGQTTVQVSDPRLELRDNILYISFDILNSDTAEKYNISIDIKDENGNMIDANALEGDIGLVEDGAGDKHITWDPGADNVFINSRIYVKVNASIILPPKPAISQIDESFNRTGIIMQSLVIPGLGLSKVTGDPHWLRAVAGYGCIAGSIVLNQQALSSYEGIDDLIEFDDKNDLYQKSSRQYNASQALAYTAIIIWVTDFIWTVAGTSDLKKKPWYSEAVELTIDPQTNAPLICIRYNF